MKKTIEIPTYDETTVPLPEYRVTTVERHSLAVYTHPFVDRDGTLQPGCSRVISEFTTLRGAEDVADAMRKKEIAWKSDER